MKKCNKCEHEYADDFNCCPHCGQAYVSDVQLSQKTPVGAKGGNCSLLEKKGGKLAKLAQSEHSNHFIQNILVFVMSFVMLICALSAGGKVLVSFDVASTYIQQNIFQIVEGGLASLTDDVLDDGEQIMEGYQKAEEEAFRSMSEKYGGEENIPEIETSKDLQNYLDELGYYMGKTGYNYCLYNAYTTRIILEKQEAYYLPFGLNNLFGSLLSLLVVVHQIILAIMAFINVIKSLAALLKRQRLSNPYKMAKTTFTFIVEIFVAFVAQPSMLIDSAGIALIVVGVLFMITLQAYKVLFDNSITECSTKFIAKKITMLALGVIAFFVLCGPIYNITNANVVGTEGSAVMPVTGRVIIFELLDLWIGTSKNHQQFLALGGIWLMFVVAIIVAGKLLVAVLENVSHFDFKDFKKSPPKRVITCAVTVVLALVMIAGLTIFYAKLVADAGSPFTPTISASIVVSIAMCIALLVVEKGWKIVPKQATDEEIQSA